jgi:MFS superfamily sulfate permease-like transporter
VILQCEAITDIDISDAELLERLDLELNEQDTHMTFVELRTRLHDLLERHGLPGTLDREHSYRSVREALEAIEATEAEPGALNSAGDDAGP